MAGLRASNAIRQLTMRLQELTQLTSFFFSDISSTDLRCRMVYQCSYFVFVEIKNAVAACLLQDNEACCYTSFQAWDL